MRTTFQILLLPLLAGFAIASLVLEPVVVSYPSDTPQSSVDTAKDVVREAGGIVTYEFSLIKGFAAEADEATLDTIKAAGQCVVKTEGQCESVVVEHDDTYSING